MLARAHCKLRSLCHNQNLIRTENGLVCLSQKECQRRAFVQTPLDLHPYKLSSSPTCDTKSSKFLATTVSPLFNPAVPQPLLNNSEFPTPSPTSVSPNFLNQRSLKLSLPTSPSFGQPKLSNFAHLPLLSVHLSPKTLQKKPSSPMHPWPLLNFCSGSHLSLPLLHCFQTHPCRRQFEFFIRGFDVHQKMLLSGYSLRRHAICVVEHF